MAKRLTAKTVALPADFGSNSSHSDAAFSRMSASERAALKSDLVAFLKAPPKEQARRVSKWAAEALKGKGPYFLFRDLAPDVADTIRRRTGARIAEVEKRLGLTLSATNRLTVGLGAVPHLEQSRQALRAAAVYDYRPMREVEAKLGAMPKASGRKVKATPRAEETGVSVTSLYDLWARDHKANGKAIGTAEDYKAKVADFIKWLGHDDALKVTKGDIAAYCDHVRHDLGRSAKTVKGKYLTCIKAIFRKGFDRDLLPVNVAAAVNYSAPKPIVNRSKGYSEEEAKMILGLANRSLLPPADGKRERRSPVNKAVGRWVPWLCCYTGARVAEITQLRKEDVIEQGGVHCIKITPEAGSVKTGLFRIVPLHPHLVEMGFLEFVRNCPEGPLFYEPDATRKASKNTQPQWAGNALGRWIKEELGKAMPKVQPNHAWRHRFKTVGRDAGIETHYLDAIQGHSNGSASAEYGETTVKALYREICRLPRVTA